MFPGAQSSEGREELAEASSGRIIRVRLSAIDGSSPAHISSGVCVETDRGTYVGDWD